MVSQPRIVFLGPEQVGGEIIGGEKRGEIVPDERAVLDIGRDVLAVFLRLSDDEFRCRCPFDVAVQFRFQRHSNIPSVSPGLETRHLEARPNTAP